MCNKRPHHTLLIDVPKDCIVWPHLCYIVFPGCYSLLFLSSLLLRSSAASVVISRNSAVFRFSYIEKKLRWFLSCICPISSAFAPIPNKNSKPGCFMSSSIYQLPSHIRERLPNFASFVRLLGKGFMQEISSHVTVTFFLFFFTFSKLMPVALPSRIYELHVLMFRNFPSLPSSAWCSFVVVFYTIIIIISRVMITRTCVDTGPIHSTRRSFSEYVHANNIEGEWKMRFTGR